jgi:hypothetical protein
VLGALLVTHEEGVLAKQRDDDERPLARVGVNCERGPESTAEVAEDAEREREREEEEETEWTLPPRSPSVCSALSALSAVEFLTLPPPERRSGRSRPR